MIAVPTTKKVASFWYYGGKHDKVYRLEIQEHLGHYDVIGLYGRRGRSLTVHVLRAGVDSWMANAAFNEKAHELRKKGYGMVKEDAATTESLTFVGQ
jgi:hypothetical protein